jgi:hypothetical protein
MRITVPGRRWNAVSALTTLAAMPGQKRLAGALAVAAVAVAISACGSSDDKTIPPQNSEQLTSALTAVETAIDNRECGNAQQEAQNFVEAVNELPESVGTEDKEKLRNAGENLEKLAADPNQCKAPPPTGTTDLSDTTTTSSTTTTPAPTESETTTTTSSTSTTSEPAPEPGGDEGSEGAPPSGTGGPPSGTGGPPSGTGGGGGETGGGGGETGGGGGVGGGTGGTGGTGTGGTGGTSEGGTG